jgi:methionyl-tRNA formyltransferase
MPLRVIFFGTPSFAVPSLRSLLDSSHPVVAVVTQPDRPRGRGHKVQPEAVKRLAVERGLRISEPGRLKDPAWLAEVRALEPDIAVVAAYGRMLPQALLDIPRLGFINVHASLLPRWRGAAPVHRAIVAGDTVTGITIMRVVLELDAGPMIASQATPIGRDETSVELEARLATIGAALTRDVVSRMEERDSVALQPQDEALATYAAKLERADSRFDWNTPASAIHDRIRGLHPWPLAATRLKDRRLLLIRSMVEREGPIESVPGTIVAARRDGLLVAAGPGVVRIAELQPEGRRPMSAGDFLNGASVREGDRFEMV